MIDSLAKHAFSGIQSTIVSFNKLYKHKQLLFYACLSPIMSFIFLTVISQILLRTNLTTLPAWIYSLFFNFINIFIFNWVYAGLLIYNFKYAEHQRPHVKQVINITIEKLSIITLWSVISTIIATSLNIITNYLNYRFAGMGLIIMSIDAIWWIINFLIMAVIIYSHQTIIESISWTYKTIIHKALILFCACSTFFIYQYVFKTVTTKILVQTPHALISWRLIKIVSEQTAIVTIVIMSLIGLLVSGLISVITLAAQSVLATRLYMQFTGKHPEEYNPSQLGKMIMFAAIALVIFCLIIFVLTSVIMIIAYRVPAIGDRIAALFV